MAETQVTQQIVSESPLIEAYKLNLLKEARDLAFNVVTEEYQDPVTGEMKTRVVRQTTPLSQQLPNYLVAGFSPAQTAAMNAAVQQGVGAYSPYMTAANQALGAGVQTTAEAADVLRAADTRRQFADAQQAMQNAALAGTGITSGVGQIGVGLGYLDQAAQRALRSDVTGRLGGAYQDVETGLGSLATAQNMAALASQADLRPATAAIGQGITGLTEAQRMAMGTAGADFAGSQALLAQAAQQPGFGQATGALGAAMGAAGQAGPSNFANVVSQLQAAGYSADDASRMAAQAAQQPGFGQAIGQGQQAIAMAQQAAAQPAIQQGIGALFQGAESGLAAAQQPGFERGVGALYGAAQQGAQAAGVPGFQQGVSTALSAAEQARMAAAQPGFGAAQQALQQGMGTIGGAAQGFQPGATQAFMNPYQQQVIDEAMRQINRQGQIAQQGLSAQAVRAGAFGGEREGVQRAELERGLMEQRASTIANLLNQGYTQAQASAMAAFEQQQQRQMAAGQGIGQLGAQQASIAAQQAGLGQQAAQQLAQAGQLQTSVAGQQAGLGMQAAGLQQQAGQADIAAAAQRAGLGQQAAQMLQQAGTGTIGAGVQQAQLGQTAAQLAAQQAALQGQLTGQQAQLQLQAAQQRFQEAGFDANTAMQMAQLQQTQQQQAAQQSQLYQGIGGMYAQQAGQQAGILANIGQTVGQQAAQQAQLGQAAAGLYGNLAQNQVAAGQGLGQLGVQQAQLGQSAANIYQQAAQGYGNLASQTGALAGQEANIQQNLANLLAAQAGQRGQMAQTAAGIYGQQAGTFQNLGQGIGALAGQQFGIGQNMAQGLGALGGQLGQLGIQQGALGQTAQALQQGDINFLYNVGQAQQAFNQQTLDAQRATALQQIYAPYQQVGFLSDVYRGAPSTQMSTQAASVPTASPFQQAVGIGLGAIGTLAGAKKAGLF